MFDNGYGIKEVYYAINKMSGDFFMGASGKFAYAKKKDLRLAILYHGKVLENYDIFKLKSDGTTERIE